MRLQALTLQVRILALALLALPVACSQSRASAPADDANAPANVLAEAGNSFGQSLKVTNVQQFEDRMPIVTDDGRPVPPRFITVIQFEAMDCGTNRDEDFNLKLSRKGTTALVRIDSQKNRTGCKTGKKQTYEVSSKELKRGDAVVITNPTLVEVLPPTE